jgi:FkbM family methyltransferase
MFGVYKRYPFPVPFRTKFFNVIRYFFTYPVLERFLVAQLAGGNSKWWPKFIPPVYFYQHGSVRKAKRDTILYDLDISKLIDHSLYFFSIQDKAWTNLFKVIKPEFYIVDAGANIGFLSMNLAKLCPQGFIYSFEPDSENFDYLQRNKNNNHFTNIHLFKTALGEKAGKAELYKMYDNNPGANRILSSQPNQNIASETIEIAVLDEFKKNGAIKKINLLKIDVEGFEPFVLKGAKEIIETWRPILFIELAEVNLRQQGYTARKLIELVESFNYSVEDARTMQPIDRDFDNHHTDILCFPKSDNSI